MSPSRWSPSFCQFCTLTKRILEDGGWGGGGNGAREEREWQERGQEERIEGWWKGSVQAAIAKCYRNNRNSFLSFEGWMSKIRVPTWSGLCLSRACFINAVFRMWPHLAWQREGELYPDYLFSKGTNLIQEGCFSSVSSPPQSPCLLIPHHGVGFQYQKFREDTLRP